LDRFRFTFSTAMSTSTNSLPPMIRRLLSIPALLAALIALTAMAPTAALAKGGGGGGGGGSRPEIRVAGTCGRGATSKLQVKARDGGLEVEFEVEHSRPRASWSVVLVQESRVAWRGRARTGAASGSFSVGRSLADYPGADQVTARAVGPRGLTCTATATLPG
jgi:hypothetical protein